MKKKLTLLTMALGLFTVLNAQTALDPGQYVNAQITAAGVYTVEAGKYYAFDGRIDLTFDVTIEGLDDAWVMDATSLPVLVGTPGADGKARNMFEIKAGGSLTLKNLLISGVNSNGAIAKDFVVNSGGAGFTLDNCAITDWQDFALRNSFQGSLVSVTNCVFINGVRLSFSKWGGFPIRLDVGADVVIYENNTTVNTGRLLANSGPFMSGVYELHNTFINQSVIAEEFRGMEYMIANNIYYNYHFLGYKNQNAAKPDDNYATYFTGNSTFVDVEPFLSAMSTYVGQNLIFREPAINDWFVGKDSISASLLWEFAEVDSFIIADDNFTIGTNYSMEPGFTTPVGNTAAIIDNIQATYFAPTGTWVDWRIPASVSFNQTTGAPSLNWPPAFDFSYSHKGLQTAGTDGLPLGDLNWFPAKKAEYLANRDAILVALRDSMENAVAVYDPLTMDKTPMITEIVTSINEKADASQLFLIGNYPNPFDQITTIKFGLKQQSNVTLTVYNIVGKKVFESTKNSAAGADEFSFDGSTLSGGIYLYTINAVGANGQTFVASNKMTLTK